MKILTRALLMVATVGLVACDSGPTGSLGFTLPDGNAEQGKANYIDFGCNSCHVSKEVPQLDTEDATAISVTLGGETTRIKTYGELVTSVINPSHKVSRRKSGDMADGSGKSKMVTFNDVMTVTELIDLVAFVQSQYTLSPYSNSNYPIYWIPDGDKKP
ncbi:MAG: cytochrome C [Proteobacteria bacterium]|nr:cytochrome C [Pseudomonadota bacterium]